MLLKGNWIVEYSSRILGLVAVLDHAGHAVLEAEKKRAPLRGMLKDYDMTVEAIMTLPYSYVEAVSKLIVRESRPRMTKDASPLALVTSVEHEQKSRKYFFSGNLGHIFRDCRLKNTDCGRKKVF